MATVPNSDCETAMVIYKITNLLNGMIYVGQTTRTVEERFKAHTKADSYIGRAIRKYGVENFSIEILEQCETLEQLNKREIFWIAYFNCKKPNGYNLTDGGDGSTGWTPTEETREKIRAAVTGTKHTAEARAKMSAANSGEKNGFFGKHHTEETKKKLSLANTGRKHTAEARAKMSAAHSGEKNGFFGKHHTEEARTKIGAASTGRKHTTETRAKMSAAHSGEKNHNFGKHPSEETLAKLSEAITPEMRMALSNLHKEKSAYPVLEAELEKRQITRRGLAKMIGVTHTTIIKKLRGERELDLATAIKIREILAIEIPLEELFKRAD